MGSRASRPVTTPAVPLSISLCAEGEGTLSMVDAMSQPTELSRLPASRDKCKPTRLRVAVVASESIPLFSHAQGKTPKQIAVARIRTTR
jgi:hypothetical protein